MSYQRIDRISEEVRREVDAIIHAMDEVGRRMPVEFRETALGGLAATPTGRAVKAKMEELRLKNT